MRLGLLTLLTVVAVVFGLLAPMASPASAAQVLVRARVCVVAGTVDVEPGVGQIPPGANNDGTYDFTQLGVVLICAGAHVHADTNAITSPTAAPEMTGLGFADSNGAFGVGNCGGTDVPLIGSFCGPYTATGFLIGPGCAGTVGGDEAANLNPANVLANDWSVTFGTSVNGAITCDTMGVSGSTANQMVGVLALQAVPSPLGIDSSAGDITDNCTSPADLPQDPGVASVWFCQIIIGGVSVMAAAGVTVP